MTTATHAKPANEPARRLYSHVVVPPDRRKFRYRFDNDSLRKAAREYVAVHTHDYTEEGLREEWRVDLEPFLVYCKPPWGVPPDPEKEFRKWARDQLAHARLEEFTSKEALLARYGPIEEWDVSNVTDMSELFYDALAFNADLSKWDVSKVTDMRGMFSLALAFNSDLSTWDVSKVTNMGGMFHNARSFNSDLSKWNVSKVTDMDCMFLNARSFNGDLSKWDVSKVTDMCGMFKMAWAFNGDLSKWDVSKVTDMGEMFFDAKCFECDLSKWCPVLLPFALDRRGGRGSQDMFSGAKAFSGRLHPNMLKNLKRESSPLRRGARWLWRLAREGVRPHVLARLAAYHLMELGARPDAEGNAPRGAIEAFCEDFSEGCAWWSES